MIDEMSQQQSDSQTQYQTTEPPISGDIRKLTDYPSSHEHVIPFSFQTK